LIFESLHPKCRDEIFYMPCFSEIAIAVAERIKKMAKIIVPAEFWDR
jgi:hypothetical protein